MSYQILHNQPADLPFIYSLFDAAIQYQKQNNYPVWPDYDKKGLAKDIELKRSYKIVIDGETAIIFTVTLDDKVVWRDMDQGNAIYLHRVVVNPKYKGQKLFGVILDWAIEFAKERNLPLVRMDTWGNNPVIKAYYESFGFNMIEYYQLPNSADLPIQIRGNLTVLLEYTI